MFQLEIPKRAAVCSRGGEALSPGMEYYSTLLIGNQDGIYERRDYCPSCWAQQTQQQSFWKSVVPAKKEASELPKKRDERALYLLKSMLSSQESSLYGEAFVLSLYLARRRKMFFRQEFIRNGITVSLYEVAETEEMLSVPKLDLSQLQIESLQTELAKKFND